LNKKNRMLGGFIAVALIMALAVAAVAFSANGWIKRTDGDSLGGYTLTGPNDRTTTGSNDRLVAYMSTDASGHEGNEVRISGDAFGSAATRFAYFATANTVKTIRGGTPIYENLTGLRVDATSEFCLTFDLSNDMTGAAGNSVRVSLLDSAGALVPEATVGTNPISLDVTNAFINGTFHDIPAAAGASTTYTLRFQYVNAAGTSLSSANFDLPITVYRSSLSGTATEVIFGYGWGNQTAMFPNNAWATTVLKTYNDKPIQGTVVRHSVPMTGARVDGTPFLFAWNRGAMTLWEYDTNVNLALYGYWTNPAFATLATAAPTYESGIVQQDLWDDYANDPASSEALNPNIVGFKTISTSSASAVDQITFKFYDDSINGNWDDLLFNLNVAYPRKAFPTFSDGNLNNRLQTWLSAFTVQPTYLGNQTALPMTQQDYIAYVTQGCFTYPSEEDLGHNPAQVISPWKVVVDTNTTGAASGYVYTLPLRVDMIVRPQDANAAFGGDENWYANNLSGVSPATVLSRISVFKHLADGTDVDIHNQCQYYDLNGEAADTLGIPSDVLQNYFGVTSSASQTVVSFYVVIVDDATPAGHSAVEARDNYFIVFDGARDGVISDPFFIEQPVTTTPTPTSAPVTVTPTTPVTVTPTSGGDSGGGGCAAFGFAPLALLLVAPVAFLARKRG